MRTILLYLTGMMLSCNLYSQKIESKIFSVTMHNVPDSAKEAIIFALAAIESKFSSPKKINYKISWEDVSHSYAKTTVYVYGDSSFPKPDVFYPIALAEKISNIDYNSPHLADIECVLRSTLNWYYKTDGNCPPDKIDLVTFIIHETIHGMGFIHSFKTVNATASFGFEYEKTGYKPTIFDTFIINEAGESLIDTSRLPNFSNDLYLELISGKKFFNGHVAKKYNGNMPVQLYAPEVYDPAGSLMHLDPAVFGDDGPNSLMNPYYTGATFNYVGDIIAGMLADIGWIHSYFYPDPIKDIEDTTSSISLALVIKADNGFFDNTVKLAYSLSPSFMPKQSIIMTFSEGKYHASIPATNKTTDIYLFFSAIDSLDRICYFPGDSSISPLKFHCGTDTIPPSIIHNPISYLYTDFSSVTIKTSATDNIAIDSVIIEYMINDNVKDPITCLYDSLNEIYSAALSFSPGEIAIGDTFKYRIIAVDKAKLSNTSHKPQTGYYRVMVEERPPVVVAYKNNFDTPTNDFILDGFTIGKAEGFDNAALHSPHPYPGTGVPQVYKQFIAQLKVPVIIQSSGSYIAFDEIVLVEPNDLGKEFGEFGFYDYVIVEGSKNESDWYAFEQKGYNSRLHNEWLVAFNSNLDKNMNSLAVGSPSMYKNHLINLRSNKVFRAGDTVNIRFRLHSDAFITGWGWSIDNLMIQDSSYFSKTYPSLAAVGIFPNPTEGQACISGLNAHGQYLLSIYSTTGQLMWSEEVKDNSLPCLDLTHYQKGIYIIAIREIVSSEVKFLKVIKQ